MIEQASLVLGNGNWAVKSDSLLGYKTIDGKYYPREMTFTRATTGTRVNADGLVELTPYNLLQYSQDFDNVAWTKSNSSITANVTIAPDGTLTADLLSNTATSSSQINYQNITVSSGANTYSIYAKANLINFVTLRTSSFDADIYSSFNLLNGTVFSQGSGHIASIESVGDGWYRCIVTFSTVTDIVGNVHAYLNKDGGSVFDPDLGASGTSSIYLWGAQLVEGSEPLDYLPTTDRLDIARIDYSTGEAALLLEPQRTNLALQSSSFDSATWSKTEVTITSNSTTAPDGTLTAERMVENTASNRHRVFQSVLKSALATTYTFSIYVKNYSGTRNVRINLESNIPSSKASVVFDTSGNVVLAASTSGSFTNASSNAELINGYWRYSLTATSDIGTTILPIVLLNNGTTEVYTGDGTSGVYLWGAQLEAGSYATSYIPTTTASVTRNLDDTGKTGVASLFNPSEGTVFLEIAALTNDLTNRGFSISNGTDLNTIAIQYNPTVSNRIRFQVSGGSTIYRYFADDIVPITNMNKLLISWKSGNCFAFINGTKYIMPVVSGTNGVPSALDRIYFSNYDTSSKMYANVKQCVVWKTQLTDAECTQLTSL